MKQMVEQLYFGLDIGTSAIKGVALTLAEGVVARAQAPNPVRYPQEGFAEFDPEGQYRNVCAVIRELREQCAGSPAGVAMAAASGNTLLCDAAGVPLAPGISWLDKRTIGLPLRALKGLSQDELWQVTGWPCLEIFPLAHLAWLQEFSPEAYQSADWYCMNSDWLLFRFVGERLIDHSTATTSHLQDQTGRCWHEPFLRRLNIPPRKLSALVASGSCAGTLTAAAAVDTGLHPRTVVVTGCFDHPAAARATRTIRPGQLLLSCGTSWVGFLPENDRQRIVDAKLLCDPFLADEGGPWGGIFSVPGIGPVIDWYIDHIIAPGAVDKYNVFNESAENAPVGAHGLMIDLLQPPAAKMVEGFARSDVSRAVMEGAVRLLAAKLDELRPHGFVFTEAVMTGGPSRSRLWPQILAKETGLKLTVTDSDAGARGAALLAAQACGHKDLLAAE